MPIYVFQTGDTYHAVSNETQGVGHLVDTLAPQVLGIVAVKHRNLGVTLDKLLRRRMSATVGNRNVPARAK